MGAPTGAFCPGPARMMARVPASKASISIVALSVSISAMISPALILSPSFLSHFTTVPSVMVSDCWGIVMGVGIEVRGQGSEVRSQIGNVLAITCFFYAGDDAVYAGEHGFFEVVVVGD